MLHAQVLPSWHGQSTTKKGKLTSSSLHLWKERVRSFMMSQRGAGKQVIKTKTLKQKRLANACHMQALDHALQGVGLSLASFQAKHPLRPLKVGEKRYMLPVEKLPLNIQTLSPDRDARSCLEFADGSRRLEVAWGSKGRMVLQNFLDMGAVGWACKPTLFVQHGIRGHWWLDPAHRRWDNCLNAIQNTGLNSLKLEKQVQMGFMGGPWCGAGFKQRMVEAAKEYYASETWECPIFQLCYPFICEDLYMGRPPLQVGTTEHMQEVWDALPSSPIWHADGISKVKQNRWFSIFTRYEAMCKYEGIMLNILMYICITEGQYDCIEATPLHSGSGSALPLAAAGPAATSSCQTDAAHGRSSGSRSVRDSGQEAMQVARQKHGSTMHLVADILADRQKTRLMTGMTLLVAPMREEHSETLVTQKTRKGNLQWHIDQASGNWPYLERMVAVFYDRDVMARLGFECSRRGPMHCLLPDGDAAGLASCMFQFLLQLLGSEIQWMRMYSEGLPGVFALLLSDDDGFITEGLQYLEVVWQTLLKAEAEVAQQSDVWLDGYLKDLLWPGSTWCREVLVALMEGSFKRVPADIHAELRASFMTQGNTKLIEDVIGKMKEAANANVNKKLGRLARWHTAMVSGVAEDADRPQVSIEANDHITPDAVCMPAALFDSKVCEFSLGDECIQDYVKNGGVQAPGAQNHLLIPAALAALMQCKADSEQLKKHWLGLVCQPGTILKKRLDRCKAAGQDREDASGCLVVSTSRFGVLLWKVTLKRAGKVYWYDLRSGKKPPWKQACLTELDSWQALEVSPMPPSVLKKSLPEDCAVPHEGIALAVDGKPMTLLQACARQGFRTLTVHYMVELIKELEVPYEGKRPVLEWDLAALLVGFVFPSMGDAEVQECVRRRRAVRKPPCESAIAEGDEDFVEAALDEGEMDMARETMGSKKGKPTAQASSSSSSSRLQGDGPAGAAAAAAAPTASPRPSSSSSVGAMPVKRKRVPNGVVTVEQAKAYKPNVAGCKLYVDETRHHRWIITYHCSGKVKGPWSTSAVYNPDVRAALLHCLRWAWAQHEHYTSEKCPWDLA
jgi:hypothetical protein